MGASRFWQGARPLRQPVPLETADAEGAPLSSPEPLVKFLFGKTSKAPTGAVARMPTNDSISPGSLASLAAMYPRRVVPPTAGRERHTNFACPGEQPKLGAREI
jgi:hypothetical protein